MINAYPTPTSTARLNNYSMARIQTQDYDQGDVRVDEQITAKDSIFARWSIQNTTTISPSTYAQTTIPGISTPVSLSDEASFAGTSFQPTQHVATSYVRVFTPSVVNDFRVGFNRYRLDYVPINFAPGAGLGNELGVPNSNVTPREQNLPIFSPVDLSRRWPDPLSAALSPGKHIPGAGQPDLDERRAHVQDWRRTSAGGS